MVNNTLHIIYPEIKNNILNNCDKNSDIIDVNELASNLVNQLFNIRKHKYKKILYHCYDIKLLKYFKFISMFLFFSGAKEKYIIDSFGKKKKINFVSFLLNLPLIIIEIILSAILVISTFVHLSIRKYRCTDNKNDIRKIAYIRSDLWFGTESGGHVAHIIGVSNSFTKLGYNLFFISSDKLSFIPDTYKTYVINPSFKIFQNISGMPELAYNKKLIKKCMYIFNIEKPDVIYQRYSLNNYSGVILSNLFNIPLILEYNSSLFWENKNWNRSLLIKKWGRRSVFSNVIKYIENFNLKHAKLVVVVSQPLVNDLLKRGIDSNKILLNPNGVDIDKYNPNIDGSVIKNNYKINDYTIVGFIGTFGKWHGVDILIKSVRYIVKEEKNIHFLLVGDGPMMPEIKDIVNKEKLSSFVTFTGLVKQSETPYYLAACDILVSPQVPNEDGSEFYGSPTKIFEYMAMGKGIIASDLGQINHILTHNTNAILVKPGDVQELANSILKLVKDKNYTTFLGQNARRDVHKYTWLKNVENIIEYLNNN